MGGAADADDLSAGARRKLDGHSADTAGGSDNDQAQLRAQAEGLHCGLGDKSGDAAGGRRAEGEILGFRGEPAFIDRGHLGPGAAGSKRDLDTEDGVADTQGADLRSDVDHDAGDIAARGDGPVAARPGAQGNASVEGAFGNMNIVNVDGGGEDPDQRLAWAGLWGWNAPSSAPLPARCPGQAFA